MKPTAIPKLSARGRVLSSSSSKRSDLTPSSGEGKRSDASSGCEKLPKIVPKSLSPDFSSVSEDAVLFDLSVPSPDLPEATIPPSPMPAPDPLNAVKKGVEEGSAAAMARLREFVAEGGEGSARIRRFFSDPPDPVFLAEVRLGIVAFLVFMVAALGLLVGSELWSRDPPGLPSSTPT